MTRLAFGDFELDPSTGELWKGEDCVRIQEQPLKLLVCLLERPGQLVGREDLQKRVWAGDIHVGFEDGLNAAAWRLRQVLGDSADRPRFIETVPRKGYRFVGKVVPLPGKTPPPSGSFPMPVFRPPSTSSAYRPVQTGWRWDARRFWLAGVLGLGLLGAGVVAWSALRPKPVPFVVAPLMNVTGDPALDYFASALSRQVLQDLAAAPGLEVQAAESRPAGSGPPPPGTLTLTWTMARDAQGYRVTVSLMDAQGRRRGDRIFLVSSEHLHQVHRDISAYLADQAAQEPRPAVTR
jgi:DNA-binding winged helix-turn-helix (wHTH) protein/TolB-like protein